jgi:hypothetical protein
VLDGDALLTLAAVTIEGFDQSCVGPAEFVRLVQAALSHYSSAARVSRAILISSDNLRRRATASAE